MNSHFETADSHLADEAVLVHGPALLPIVYRCLGPHLLLLEESALHRSLPAVSRHASASTYNILQDPISLSASPLKETALPQNSHIAVAIKSLDACEPVHPKVSTQNHHQPLTPKSHSQLAIRPNANQHLRVTPHSRLQQRQRPVAHLPVFLHHAERSAKSKPGAFPRLPSTPGPEQNIPAEQSHTRYSPREEKEQQSAFPSAIPSIARSITLTCTRCEASGEAP